eukprot:2276400-Ditylum_brightwellii.AAC.1
MGDLPGFRWVWYYPNGIANILSLSRVKEKYRVTFDSYGNCRFIVHKGNGEVQIFQESKRGLFYLNMRGKDEKKMGEKERQL